MTTIELEWLKENGVARLERFRDEFEDLCNSDSDFNYSEDEFEKWMLELVDIDEEELE